MKIPLLTILFCLFSFLLLAQETTYQVLFSQGNVLSNGKTIAPKASLKASQGIEIGENSYVCLISANKKEIIEVNKKGVFKIKDLPKDSYTSNYAKFVIDELVEPIDKKLGVKSRFQHINKTKSVYRCPLCAAKAMIPKNKQYIYGNQLFVKWYVDNNVFFKDQIVSYKVVITNLDGLIIFSQQTTDKQIKIDITQHQSLQKEDILIFKVIPLDKNNKELEDAGKVDGNGISKLAPEQYNEIIQELESMNTKNSVFGKLIEARFFEDKELYLDAIVAYEEALNLSFGAKEVEKVYQFFLERNGLALPEDKE